MVNKKTLALFLIFLAGFIVRFYNYPQRINFSAEQGLALGTSADYVKEKFTLLGQRTFLRTTSKGHILFSGSLYNYSLIPLLLIFRYQPLPITAVFTMLNFLTGLTVYLLVKKMLGYKIAFTSLILFMFSDVMIQHSLHIWILDYIPLISILSIYLIWRYKIYKKKSLLLLLGVLSGIGFNLEYFYLFTIFLIAVLLFLFSRRKLLDLVIYIVGLILGNWTMVIFDLRHDFYYFKTLWQYFLDALNNPGQSQISSYHFLQFWPIFFIILAILINRISEINKYLGIGILSAYLFFNLFSPKVSFSKAVGMSEGLNYKKIYLAAKTIAQNNPSSFNLVNLPDSDFRSYSLRYLVKYIFGKNPANMENYKDVNNLYVLSRSNFQLNNSQPGKLQFLMPVI